MLLRVEVGRFASQLGEEFAFGIALPVGNALDLRLLLGGLGALFARLGGDRLFDRLFDWLVGGGLLTLVAIDDCHVMAP